MFGGWAIWWLRNWLDGCTQSVAASKQVNVKTENSSKWCGWGVRPRTNAIQYHHQWHSQVQHTLDIFADDIKLSGAVDLLEGRDVYQVLENWVSFDWWKKDTALKPCMVYVQSRTESILPPKPTAITLWGVRRMSRWHHSFPFIKGNRWESQSYTVACLKWRPCFHKDWQNTFNFSKTVEVIGGHIPTSERSLTLVIRGNS